jgi:DNA anti-recombination protein RmuC
VPGFPSFLDRFRRLIAPPGRPGEALGVPASGEDLHGELGPVFEQLDAVASQAREIEREAAAEVEQRRTRAHEQATAILERARGHAEEERTRAELEQREEVKRRAAELQEESGREAQRIRAASADRVPELLSEVLECVRRSGR